MAWLLYAWFAILSIGVNISTQAIVAAVCHGAWTVPLQMVAGTATGLVTKYVLDRKYIFNFQPRDVQHEGRTFLAYSLMGLATTAIFWATELLFDRLFGTTAMRLVGGTIGLIIGYTVKYWLDATFVFRPRDETGITDPMGLRQAKGRRPPPPADG